MSLTKIIIGAVLATSFGAATLTYEKKQTEEVQKQSIIEGEYKSPETRIEFINIEKPLEIVGNPNNYNPNMLETINFNNLYE